MKPDLVRQQAYQTIQRHLGHKFVRVRLLQQALTHRSFNAKNNECSELIGDAILSYSIAKMLLDALPRLTEGKLSRLRANLVNEYVPAEIVLETNIGDGLYLGAGELESGDFRRSLILADVMEAMFAAVGFDTSFAAMEEVTHHLFAECIKRVDFRNQDKDNKMVLQEALQARHLPLLEYCIGKQIGNVKGGRSVASCDLDELGLTCRAQGTNRKVAE